nr:MAG TPA: hypothetical protein [Caudoviricetes sp.]
MHKKAQSAQFKYKTDFCSEKAVFYIFCAEKVLKQIANNQQHTNTHLFSVQKHDKNTLFSVRGNYKFDNI